MAPATRNSVRKQPPARKQRLTRQTSSQELDWHLESRQDSQPPADENDTALMQQDVLDQENWDMEQPDFDQDLVLESRESPQLDATLNPLREMADQVGREVEKFAEKLDKFFGADPTPNKFEAVLELVQDFKEIAEESVKSLQKNHQRDVALQLRKEWNERENLPTQSSALMSSASGLVLTEDKAQQVKKLRQWQQEADIWELFSIMLELHHNPDRRGVQQQKDETLHRLGHVHRYTSEEDIFTRFVLQDDLAHERLMVKRWLEQTADHQESDISGITQELESKTSRGRGMWQNGWMHTREKIKGEKRTRSWSNTPGVPLPHVKRKDNTQLLVTTLDPDAISRQERALEKDDEYFERAMWIACWEILRRGMSWEDISDWCQQKREGWRAFSLGAAMEPGDCLSKANWRHMCYLASQADGFGDYEAAVYGLLGGSYGSVQKVSRNVDDKLYGYYNAALIRQFDQYLVANYPERASQTRRGLGEDAVKDPQQQIVELIERLRKRPETSSEAIQPMKIIQSYLLADDLGSLIHTMGFAISHSAAAQDIPDGLIMRLEPFWPGTDNQPEGKVVDDHQTLRIAMHISILLAVLRNEELEGQERDAEENVTVAYIQSLRELHNRYIIPLYASRLKNGRQIITMARALEDVKTSGEQTNMLRLMEQYSMNTILILDEQILHLLSKHVGPRLAHVNALSMLEKTENSLYPGQCIRLGFLPKVSTADDEAVIRGLQWYNIIGGHWRETFRILNLALRKCLMAGRIACALSIVNKFPYDTLSRRKSYPIFGRSINLMAVEGEIPDSHLGLYYELRGQARTYYDLSQLVEAIKALANFRQVEAQYTGKALKLSSAPPSLKEAKGTVDEAMAIVLHRKILEKPEDDEDEVMDLAFIRKHYIPELIIAYNTVLHSAGAVISRENLIQSMDLSVEVANNGFISKCFKDAGRMGELVKSFAETSKKMLVLKAEGKPWKPRKEEGKDLGIWEIRPQQHSGNHEIAL